MLSVCLDLVSAKNSPVCFLRQASSKRQHHLNKHLYRPSTFLTSYEPPVFMDEDDEHAAYFGSVQDPSADDSVSPPSHRSSSAATCRPLRPFTALFARLLLSSFPFFSVFIFSENIRMLRHLSCLAVALREMWRAERRAGFANWRRWTTKSGLCFSVAPTL